MMHKISYSLKKHKVKNAVATLNAGYFLHLSTINFQATYEGNTAAWELTYSLVFISTKAYVLCPTDILGHFFI